MDSYRSSVVESLCALVSCCYTVPPAHASTSADDDIYMSQQQQQSKRLPWFLGGKEDTNISTETLTNSRDDVLAANSTAIGPANQPPPRWIKDDHIDTCTQCSSAFDLLTRKHHCRACGLVFCKNCTSQRERVIKYGFPEPVRVCLACSIDARAENAFYEKHLPLLEQGAVFVKRGLLLKRLVEFKFIRTKLLFQYQTLDSDTRLPVANEIKAFALDNITDVKQVSIDRENGMLSLLILVGTNNEEHRFDASTPEQKQQWLAAIESLRSLRSTLVGRERDRRAKQAEAQHNEMLKVTESMKQLEERKASFRQERIQKRAEQREMLRAKYKLGSSSSNVNATTA